jgi:hypothetical protein
VTVNLHHDRPAPPPLEAQAPLCGVCGNEVGYELGYFSCENCEAYWPVDDAFTCNGEWDEPDAKRCTSTDEYGGEQVRCVLAAGHTAGDCTARRHTSPFRGRTRMWRTGVAR